MCGPPLTDKFISHQCQYQSRIFAACRRSQTLKDKTPTAVTSNLCSLVAFDVLSVRSFDPAVRYLKYEFVSNALTFVALDKGPSAEPNRPHSEEKSFRTNCILMTFTHFVTGISSGILPGISYGILPGISSVIFMVKIT